MVNKSNAAEISEFIPRMYVFDAPELMIMKKVFSGCELKEIELKKPAYENVCAISPEAFQIEMIKFFLTQNDKYPKRVTIVFNADAKYLTFLRFHAPSIPVVYLGSSDDEQSLKEMYIEQSNKFDKTSESVSDLNDTEFNKAAISIILQDVSKRASQIKRERWRRFKEAFCR